MNDDEFSAERLQLSSNALSKTFNINNDFVINDVFSIYKVLVNETNASNGKNYTLHINELYQEWLFNYRSNPNLSNSLKVNRLIYRLKSQLKIDADDIDEYKLLFTVQTYFILIVKLLIANVVERSKNNSDVPNELSWSYITALFWNNIHGFEECLKDFFETSYYEWFVSVNMTDNSKIHSILNGVWQKIDNHSTMDSNYVCGLFNGLYIDLFDDSNLNVPNNLEQSSFHELPDYCSLTATKAVQLLVHYSKMDNFNIDVSEFNVIYVQNYNISETRLEYSTKILNVRTSVGDFQVPKLYSFQEMKYFMDQLHASISDRKPFNSFWQIIQKSNDYKYNIKRLASKFYEKLMLLRSPIQYDFWTINIKHRITPDLF